ncbi:twin transmembrane helix small protein [Pseudohoeflea coraliihabitans]|uniref:Twin transmembrane helix small protein n=1 Tax=Pseudohoeflea coraliihabitans TaxID=2860393 RepID=A0ABS6WKN8_9HYPH|nr:twin transmembrane helix small protein [Pseudohoeflea sp. DP4N28-3]MBW3096508.1 twin transmembrane helix small protein [Pseudohoeflea sp. DP4N28-3]
MSTFTYYLAIIVMFAVAVVLVRGLINMARGGSGNASNKMMQMRVLLQFVAIVLIVATIWLTGAGR